MSPSGRKLQDMVRALCVVALVFLNFGHAPVAAGAQFVVAPSAHDSCGDPVHGPGDTGGNPCQVCRIGASIDLPPVPLAVFTGDRIAHQVHYAPDRPAALLRAAWRSSAPRAPPDLA